jgi:hypothetical protein
LQNKSFGDIRPGMRKEFRVLDSFSECLQNENAAGNGGRKIFRFDATQNRSYTCCTGHTSDEGFPNALNSRENSMVEICYD